MAIPSAAQARKKLFRTLYVLLLLLGIAVILFSNNSLFAYIGITPMIAFIIVYLHYIDEWKAFGYSLTSLNILFCVFAVIILFLSGWISRLIVYIFEHFITVL